MEIQISPISAFKAKNECESASKRFKSTVTFHCIVCNSVYEDPNVLYEHMKVRHPELYERDGEPNNDELFDLDADETNRSGYFDCEMSDDEYVDLSRILEPICELRHDGDEENVNESAKNDFHQLIQPNGYRPDEERLRLQLKLQLQLENNLKQELIKTDVHKAQMPLALRESGIDRFDFDGTNDWGNVFHFMCSTRTRSRSSP